MNKSELARFEWLREELKISQIGYLLTDLEMGHTFVKMAMESANETKRARTTREARIVYDTVLRFLSKISLTEMELENIADQLASLKSDLQCLGETF